MRVALLFIDGVGIGRNDPATNPLARRAYLLSRFEDGSGAPLPPGIHAHPVDTTFGLPGRPQSASNQTAILTGEPAPQLIGGHVLGFPDRPLRELLGRRSIVKHALSAGRTATYANCYPAAYLDALKLARRPSTEPEIEIPPRVLRRIRPSAFNLAMAAGGVPLRTLADARAGQALTHDLTGAHARERFEVPLRTAEEAAAIFWAVSEELTLLEHYQADQAGHARDFDAAESALVAFDDFARAVISTCPADAHILICSDHGNVEELSTRGHTRNKVAVLSFGAGEELLPPLNTVADVGQAVLRLMGLER